jgi:hypothetical protein
MPKRERLLTIALLAALLLLAGLLDGTDTTPAVIRLPIGLAATSLLAWALWRASGER